MKIISSSTPKFTKYVLTEVADIPGGVSLDTTDLVNGKQVLISQGVTAPTNGLRKVCKQFTLLAGSTTTALKVDSDKNQAKVSDVIGVVGGKAYAVTSITTSNGVDTINLATAIDAVATNDILVQCTTTASTSATALNVPVAILKEGFVVDSASTFVQVPALTHANVLKGALPKSSLDVLKGIVEISY